MSPIRLVFALVYAGAAWDDSSLVSVGRANLNEPGAPERPALIFAADEFMVARDDGGWIGAADNSAKTVAAMTD